MLAFALSCVHSRGVIAKIIAYAAIGISATLTSPSPAQQVRRATAAREAQPEYSIAFANFGPINTDIFIAAPDGSKPVPLSAHPGRDCNASFSSDGRWIIFTSDRAGSADIFRIHPDGSGIERLTDDPAFDDQGSLSPDGKSLAFVSSRGGHVSIWLLDLATRTSRNLTAGHPLSDFRPSWSPDGQWIAFSSQRDSKKPNATRVPENEIYIVRPDGSGLRRITTEQEFAGSPSWSPDSSRLVFYQGTIVEVMKIRDARHLRGTTQIVSVVVKTSERQVLTSGDGEKWSPRYLAPNRVAYVSGGPSGGIEVVANAPAARGEFGSPDWSRDGRSMVFHREVVHNWPPLQEWHSPDPKFRLIRTGVFPTYAQRPFENERRRIRALHLVR
jgi:dipeptidyl aminopeptidase/acylaminoacyl peptidase